MLPRDDASAATPCDLKLLVDARLAPAVIGRGGSAVRMIKGESGVRQIHLSQNSPEWAADGKPIYVGDRTVTVTGPKDALVVAYRLITKVLRSEAGLAVHTEQRTRVLVPDVAALAGGTAIRLLRERSGAEIRASPAPAGAGSSRERLLTLSGAVEEVELAVVALMEGVAERHHARHAPFLSQWRFETNYNDHFETPRVAYEHVMPVLRSIAASRYPVTKRKHGDDAGSGDASIRRLQVYDPYFCQGAMRDSLAALGLARENVINENRDFYADAGAGLVPAHDVLLTNPPYSADHKQRMLSYLLQAQGQERAAPFLLLMPAWLAGTDYWVDFLWSLAALRSGVAAAAGRREGAAAAGQVSGALSSSTSLEWRAGVFYISPAERYNFAHPQATGHASSPFHAVWFCGGWEDEPSRKAAMRALKGARSGAALEVFRSAAMLQRRGHFTPGSVSKRVQRSTQ